MKLRFLILLLLTLSLLTGVVFARSEGTYLWDGADVLTQDEEKRLNQELAQVSANLNTAIVVATVHNEAYNVRDLANTFFHERTGYENGVILYLAFGQIDNDYHIEAQGTTAINFTERMYDMVENACVSHLRLGAYAEAISAYAHACEDAISSYGKISIPGLLGCIVIGMILSFLIPMMILKNQLKTVRYQSVADNYVQKGSLVLTAKTDTFLNRNISRISKPKSNPGGGSRGGGSRGGGSHGGGRSGKF